LKGEIWPETIAPTDNLVHINRMQTNEHRRLHEDKERQTNWKRWGTYLSERQWSTVREDYSHDSDSWAYLPHEHARSRAYRWGEDGLLGWSDRQCRLCMAPSVWNHTDAILKERLFGLTNAQGNHGEDVKEEYYYLDATPTHSYAKGLYKYPQTAFPYNDLVRLNNKRGLLDREFELRDAGAFAENRYFDIEIEYAKAGANDMVMRITAHNRGPEAAPITVAPTLWFRNNWSWGCPHEGCSVAPTIQLEKDGSLKLTHEELGTFSATVSSGGTFLFTENNTNSQALFGSDNETPYVKDAFHRYIVKGEVDAVNPKQTGTKVCAVFEQTVAAGESIQVHMRLREGSPAPAEGAEAEQIFIDRIADADAFYQAVIQKDLEPREFSVARQAYAGLVWSKQFYHYIVKDWLAGDDCTPKPPPQRKKGRNHEWGHVYAKDILSMPDKWEYPWFAAWDTAFHMIPYAKIDPEFAKMQLLVFLREWYMHPNGQIPAYEFAFDDVNPPVHAWACWRVYKLSAERGHRDHQFLEGAFQKLLINFTWWVNRKDENGNNLFSGGFLGLDNIGVFDRSRPLPNGGFLQQADGTAWMAFYCLTMMAIALELAIDLDGEINKAYSDMASKFFEHFVQISDAMNAIGDHGLWNETDGFYYDQMILPGREPISLSVRSMVGLIPLLAVEVLEAEVVDKLPGFKKRFEWFMKHQPDLAQHLTYRENGDDRHWLMAIPSEERLRRVLELVLDENEFLSPHGVRSLSKRHEKDPFMLAVDEREYWVDYVPGESNSHLFGGNSNWRGPIWMPVNFLLAEALERYAHFYGSDFKVKGMTLREIAQEIHRRNGSLFVADDAGRRPAHGEDRRYTEDPHYRDLVLFYEFFNSETGEGLGASHQTGWTALVARSLEKKTHTGKPPESS